MAPGDPARIEPPAVYIADTGTAKGRGAFAARAFAAGELVEACPVVPFHLTVGDLPAEIERIMFGWGYLVGEPGPQAIVLGRRRGADASLPRRARHRRRRGADRQLLAIGGSAEWQDDAWFRRMKVEPITGS